MGALLANAFLCSTRNMFSVTTILPREKQHNNYLFSLFVTARVCTRESSCGDTGSLQTSVLPELLQQCYGTLDDKRKIRKQVYRVLRRGLKIYTVEKLDTSLS